MVIGKGSTVRRTLSRVRASAGLTLVELLTALAVLGVLLVVGVPSFAVAIESARLSSHANRFLAHLHLARSEAILRNRRVVLCVADGEACASAGSAWHQGWLVFVDLDNDGLRALSEPLLARADALADGSWMSGNASVARYVSFSPTGATRLTSGAFQAGTITLCSRALRTGSRREIIINAVGRARIHQAPASSCG